jgi:1-acyl-sn-glycerol-3-phosphate acyltransferase
MDTEKSHIFSKMLTVFVFNPLIYLAYNYRVEGSENLPGQGPFILAMKHQSWIDIPVSCSFTKLQPTYMGKKELLENILGDFEGSPLATIGKIVNPFTSWVLKSLGMIPIDRDCPSKTVSSFKLLKEKILAGDSIAFYPEGKIVKDEMGEFKPGFIRMILRLQKEGGISIPFVPVGISYQKERFLRKKLLVKIGEPVTFDWNDRHAHEVLHQEVAKLTNFEL